MQCHPVPVGAGLAIVLCAFGAAGLNHEVAVHKTGIMQVFAGIGAGLACLGAVALVAGAMKIVDSSPAPVQPAAEQPVPAGRKPAVVTAMTLRPEERAEMEAEADMLAGDDTTLVVSERGAVYGLQDEPEDAP
jgi:hypothetical protein